MTLEKNTLQKNNITGILLAAGSASRFGADKRLININNQSMVVAAAKKLKNALPDTRVVITNHDQELETILKAENISYILCNDAEKGIGASLSCAIRHTPNADAWLIALGDMPFISDTSYTRILHKLGQGASICAPGYKGQRGHPVGFQNRFKQELMSLSDDKGARDIINKHKEQLSIIDVDDPGILIDIDTRQDLQEQAL